MIFKSEMMQSKHWFTLSICVHSHQSVPQSLFLARTVSALQKEDSSLGWDNSGATGNYGTRIKYVKSQWKIIIIVFINVSANYT